MNKIISIILSAVLLFSMFSATLTVEAAAKNTVKTSITKIEPKAKGFKVTWKKKSKIKGYQIQYSTSSKFKKSSTKTKTVTKSKTKTATISKLKGCNKKYYVRVRTYKISKGKKVYSAWGKVKTVTTLKHKYNKATCTKAKTCKYCAKTSGKKLRHSYSNATCTDAKKCSRCGTTTGSALGHDLDNIEIAVIPTYTQPGEYSGVCLRCNTKETVSVGCLVATSTKIREEMLRLINIEREKAGVGVLQYYKNAQIALDARAQELQYLYSHTRPNGYNCFSVLNDYDIPSGFTQGENIAYGFNTVENVMKGWMNSPGHRNNILGSQYTHVAIGKYEYGWVQMFFG